jgi:hypothetical protein
MGPRQWTYGQRSRSNPRSHPGSLHRRRIKDVNFRPTIDSAEGAPRLGTSTDTGERMAAVVRDVLAPVGAGRGFRASLPRLPDKSALAIAGRQTAVRAWRRLSGRRWSVAAVCADYGTPIERSGAATRGRVRRAASCSWADDEPISTVDRVGDRAREVGMLRTAHEPSAAGTCIYVPGSNGPGSEKPSIEWTLA